MIASLRTACAALWLLALAPAVQSAGKPSEALDDFQKALRTNQPDKAVEALARDAVIYEQGFAETSRDEWVRKQLGNAIAFARDTERRVVRRQAGEAGNAAWVISTTQTLIDVSDRKVMLEGAETAILRREDSDWKIVHLHWSAHEATPEDTAKATQKESDPAPAASSPGKPAAKSASKPATRPSDKKR